MMRLDEVVAAVEGLAAEEVTRWVEAGWVRPARDERGFVFREVDVARCRLIAEVRFHLELDLETLPVVLSLIDQLYETRGRLHALGQAVAGQPEAVREAIWRDAMRRLAGG